jgi:hypothetical protein
VTNRDEIVAGLKRWAIGSYPAQAAVTFLAATNEPLSRVWVRQADGERFTFEEMYYLDWEAFDKYGGGLSGGEYATWHLARSLHEGELMEHLWRLDPDRSADFAEAISRCRQDWR